MALKTGPRPNSTARRSAGGRRLGETTKVTFVLPNAMAEQLKEAVATGDAASQNALAREALEREFKRRRELQIAAAYRAAAADPMWSQDVEETMRAFEPLDVQASRMLPQEDS